MYRHLLLATDASDASRRASALGIGIARSLAARVTAIMVTPTLDSSEIHAHAILRAAREHAERGHREARKGLDPIERDARTAGVPCETVHAVSDQPWRAIIDTADAQGCDLIVLGSHGRSALEKLVLGSQADKVLSHARISVLVVP